MSRLELGQVQEREAYSASDSSALEQVQERVADLASDPSVLEASSQYCVAQPVRTLWAWVGKGPLDHKTLDQKILNQKIII